jgi:peptidoglycan L-alanyl-D-glutamate endopeptidase CwlK
MANREGMDPGFLVILGKFEAKMLGHGYVIKMTDGFRSYPEQNELYARGRTKKGSKVTNAKAGYSWHNFGFAADYCFVVNGKITWSGPWSLFGRVAKRFGLEWGGDFKFVDRPHVQLTKGRTLASMRKVKKR